MLWRYHPKPTSPLLKCLMYDFAIGFTKSHVGCTNVTLFGRHSQSGQCHILRARGQSQRDIWFSFAKSPWHSALPKRSFSHVDCANVFAEQTFYVNILWTSGEEALRQSRRGQYDWLPKLKNFMLEFRQSQFCVTQNGFTIGFVPSASTLLREAFAPQKKVKRQNQSRRPMLYK